MIFTQSSTWRGDAYPVNRARLARPTRYARMRVALLRMSTPTEKKDDSGDNLE